MAFWKSLFSRSSSSKEVAKKRLQLLLIHDQVDLTPDQMIQMKHEIVDVIERYICVETEDTHVVLDRMDKQIRLVGSIPLRENTRRKRSTG